MQDELTSAFTRAGFTLIETHISRVFLRGDDVYKTKRPVSLGFVDFSTLARREQACEAELRLNRRLAPDVYRGVVAVVRAGDGTLAFVPRDALAGAEVLEWAVHMHRLGDDDRADTQLARDAFGHADVEAIAGLLARFHEAHPAEGDGERYGSPAQIEANVEQNFAQVADTIGAYLEANEADALRAYQRAFLRAERARLEARVEAGRIRDGHGDLRLEHVYRQGDAYVVIDCIEFNDAFRFADVCADIAFLAMDLSHHGHVALSEALVARYAEASLDFALYPLLDFYASYRAVVRAKVASILAADADVASVTRERAAHEARRYYLLALAEGKKPLAPARLIVSFGPIASGKSTLARALGRALSVPVVSADPLRKRLLGGQPTDAHHDAPFAGAYAPEVTGRVYAQLFEAAEQVLETGRSVLLDATFRAKNQRALARALARKLGVEVVFLECRAGRAVTLERLARRAAEGPHVSDGRAEIYDRVTAAWQPSAELTAAEHLVLDTERPLEETLAEARAHLA